MPKKATFQEKLSGLRERPRNKAEHPLVKEMVAWYASQKAAGLALPANTEIAALLQQEGLSVSEASVRRYLKGV